MAGQGMGKPRSGGAFVCVGARVRRMKRLLLIGLLVPVAALCACMPPRPTPSAPGASARATASPNPCPEGNGIRGQLTLDPASPSPGDRVIARASGLDPGAPYLLYAVATNDLPHPSPWFASLASVVIDSSGKFEASFVMPPGHPPGTCISVEAAVTKRPARPGLWAHLFYAP